MRVLGIDPGTATTGYGVVEGKGMRLRHIAHGTLTTPPEWTPSVRLKSLFEQANALLEQYTPDAVAIEKLYFTKNITTGIAVAQARGVLVLSAELAGLRIAEFTPLEVKNAVTGYGKAPKRQVQEMLRILLTLDDIPRPDDAADALALAVCLLSARNHPSQRA